MSSLDSRQRKKQHTERLEEEKKVHSAVIAELEEKLAMLQLRDNEWRQRLEAATQERDAAKHDVEILQMEKEEMVKAHTIETGDLRKKNNMLISQCQKLEHILESGRSSAPSAGTFDDEFDIDSDFWEQSPFTEDYATPKPKKETKAVEEEKPVQGLLLILLLCGAFVASSQTSSPSALPPLPAPIRTASAGILQNIFNEAGVSSNSQGRIMEAPDATSSSWLSNTSTGTSVGLASSLDLLTQTLTSPSAEQEREEMRQLTAAEYNEITSKEFREPESVATRGRRQIAEGLASMGAAKGSAAEVYTRSLLWDRVDAEVVRRFAAFAQAAQKQNAGDAMSV